jgi:hypothetical protein
MDRWTGVEVRWRERGKLSVEKGKKSVPKTERRDFGCGGGLNIPIRIYTDRPRRNSRRQECRCSRKATARKNIGGEIDFQLTLHSKWNFIASELEAVRENQF